MLNLFCLAVRYLAHSLSLSRLHFKTAADAQYIINTCINKAYMNIYELLQSHKEPSPLGLNLNNLGKCTRLVLTVKPVVSGHSKRTKKLKFKTGYSLMQVKSIAESSKGSFTPRAIQWPHPLDVIQYARSSYCYKYVGWKKNYFSYFSTYTYVVGAQKIQWDGSFEHPKQTLKLMI